MSGTGPGASWMPPGTGSRVNGATAPPISGDLWQWVDPRLLPPRPWLLGTTLLRGYTTLLGSPGGTGKTAWAVAAALAVITGRKDILGLHSFVQGAVWFITLEDDKAEMQRRIAAVMMEHIISPADIGTNLFLTDGTLKLVEYGASGMAEATQSVDDAKDFIRDNNIILTVIDPLVKAHSVNGSKNEDMDVLITVANEIARDTGSAVLLPCHFRKGGDLDYDGAALFRGASSLVDGSRIAQGMQGMTKKEGEEFGVSEDDVGRFVRMVNLKANMVPKADATDWFELVSIRLGNDRVDPTYPAGDAVQAIRHWQAPKLFDGMDRAVMVAVFDRLGDPSQVWSPTRGNQRMWAGDVIVAQAGKSVDQAKRILRLWMDSGVVEVVTHKVGGHDRQRAVLNRAKADAVLAGMGTSSYAP